jgi:uncharacterized membrane protein
MTSYASARNETATQRVVRAFLILSSLALLAASIDRATWPFGYDESQSFASFNGRPGVLATANHHLLNTVLMRLCSVLFGNSELALRLPNVLAHGLYLFSALSLVGRVRNPFLQVLGFVLLNLNLLVVEYFAVARGYGLALAFQLFSLLLFVRACDYPAHRFRNLLLSLAMGCLSVLSNWAWVYYHVPLVAVAAWFLATPDLRNELSRKHRRTMLVALPANGIFLVFVLTRLLRLRRDRELYFGGYHGFIGDTVQSLVRCSLAATMDAPAIVTTTAAILVGSVALILPFAARQWVQYGRPTLGRLSLLLTLAIALPLVGHYLFGAVFPIERAALYYLPLYVLVLLYTLNDLQGRESWTRLAVPSFRWPQPAGPSSAGLRSAARVCGGSTGATTAAKLSS